METENLIVWDAAKVGRRKVLGLIDDSSNLWKEKRNWQFSERGLVIMDFLHQKRFEKHRKVLYLSVDREEASEMALFRSLMELQELSKENVTVFAWCQICSMLTTNGDVKSEGMYFKKMGRFLHTCARCEDESFPMLKRGTFTFHTNIYFLNHFLPKQIHESAKNISRARAIFFLFTEKFHCLQTCPLIQWCHSFWKISASWKQDFGLLHTPFFSISEALSRRRTLEEGQQ